MLPAVAVPAALYHAWQKEELQSFAWNARALAASRQVLQVLEAQAIPVVSLRGLTLAHTLYPRPELRYMADVDLLLRAADVPALERALAGLGLEPVKRLRSQLVYQVRDIMFEIHYSFLTPKRYRAALDTEEFVASRRPLSLPQGVLPVLPPEKELIGVIAHSFIHHELSGLVPLLDAALLACAQDLDWEEVARWSEQARLSRMFHFSLAFINELFQLGIESALRRAFPEPLPSGSSQFFEAYLAYILGMDAPRFYFRRLRERFIVAESSATWLRQLLRLFAKDEWNKFHKSFRPPAKKKGRDGEREGPPSG
jgi:hypothetical protein